MKNRGLHILLGVLLVLSQAQASLIGFDFGSSYMKATLVQPGRTFQIVENTASKRKTESMVTVGVENRLFGADSLLESSKYPKETFTEIFRTFGQKFDSDTIAKFKKERFITNEFVQDERGNVAWKVTRPKLGKEAEKEEILYSEEVIATLMNYVKMLAEKQNGGPIRDCVITVPSWFTYDQRLMFRDAAEGLSGLNVLQLVHENTATAVMYAIDKRNEGKESQTVLFYNMGGMDTEAAVVRYTFVNETEKKSHPQIEILGEAYNAELGSKDVDNYLVNILANKFNALPEREGKTDVRENVRAMKRLQKEVIKIKEVLSANIQAFVKVPELLDEVTLQLTLQRETLETEAAPFFEMVAQPALDAIKKAGLEPSDIDLVELLGGGVRVPKVTSLLEKALNMEELGVHLNGDEAMCFGSAFIATNSSSDFKVKKMYLTQALPFDVHFKLQPLKDSDNLSEEDQKAEGVDEEDIIKYSQENRLFNSSDYMGKSKALTFHYNKDMKI